jgi:hypothetical protein
MTNEDRQTFKEKIARGFGPDYLIAIGFLAGF